MATKFFDPQAYPALSELHATAAEVFFALAGNETPVAVMVKGFCNAALDRAGNFFNDPMLNGAVENYAAASLAYIRRDYAAVLAGVETFEAWEEWKASH